jgi:histidinol-phosphate aminotransferase
MAKGIDYSKARYADQGKLMSAQIPVAVQKLMRPSAAALEPYDPAFSPVEVNLSANENSFGLPDGLREAVARSLAKAPTNRYPLPLAPSVREILSEMYGVGPEHIICGNGGDELLFNLFVAFGGAGHTVLHCPPDFSVYDLYAGLLECDLQEISRDPQTFDVDEKALIAASSEATLTVVTSPNNPTGNVISHDLVVRLCEACPGLVLIDEAYMEFADTGSSCVDLLQTYDNLVVLRTLSKAYALAGVRLGYMLASPGVISALAAVRQPYSISVLDQTAAKAVLERREELGRTLEQIKEGRSRLYSELQGLSSKGLEVWPSQANFLLVRLPHAHEVRCQLRDDFSVLVRDFSSAPGLKDCLRLTVGTPQDNERLIDGFRQILEG